MKCDEHILLRFLASSLSVSQSPSLHPRLPASLSVVATVLTLCSTAVFGGGGGGYVFPSCECECDCELLWMCVRDNLFVSSSFRLLFFPSLPSLPLSLSLCSSLFCFPVASFKHDNKDYSWSLLLLLLLAKH